MVLVYFCIVNLACLHFIAAAKKYGLVTRRHRAGALRLIRNQRETSSRRKQSS
jgi:hypothetical protein